MPFLWYFLSQSNNTTTQELAQQAEIKLQAKEGIAKSNLDLLSEVLKLYLQKNFSLNTRGQCRPICIKKEGIAIYVYQHDSLCLDR